jgi:small subunit ribosomal protein S14
MKGKIFNDKIRRVIASQHEALRNSLRYITHTESIPIQSRYIAQFKLAELPRSSNIFHLSRRCVATGRGKSILREFNVSRIIFRKLALEGRILGVKRASW